MTKVQMMGKQIWLIMLLLLAVACAPGAGQSTVSDGSTPGTEPPAEEQTPETVTMWVAAETADCVGVAPQTCLQVKFAEDGEWQFFYDSIVGFDYVPGFEYELLVNKREVEDAPADASTLRYELVAVVSETAVDGQTDISLLEQLMGTDWNLIEWEGMTILPNAIPTIAFDENGLRGTTGCNSYFGSFALEGTAVTIGEVGMTEMWCEGVMDQEQAFLAALQTAESLTLEGDTLTLHTAEGALTFQPPTEATLTDTQWVLGGIADGDAVVNTWIDSDITAEFKDGTMGGSSGCNSYSVSYETDGSTLTLGQAVGTLMACAEEERSQRETEFLTALANIAQYEIQRNTLTLMDADGNLVMTFQVQDQTQ
ncbi:MAG: META domain-containing protein [Ardenticatenaceae bacterium]|nr:META domain-containing protein [Ardenticatenaceae bacterium]